MLPEMALRTRGETVDEYCAQPTVNAAPNATVKRTHAEGRNGTMRGHREMRKGTT